jgi:hypothetical protein
MPFWLPCRRLSWGSFSCWAPRAWFACGGNGPRIKHAAYCVTGSGADYSGKAAAMSDRPLGDMVGAIIALPFAVLGTGFRAHQRWRAVPLLQKSHTRAGLAAAVLVALGIYIFDRGLSAMTDDEFYAAAGIGAFAVLYLVVGIIGSRGRLRFDPMSIFWFGALGLGAIALLVMYGGSL